MKVTARRGRVRLHLDPVTLIQILNPKIKGWANYHRHASSKATFQHLEYNGRKLGHILNPRTGWPAEGLASATVLAPTAAEADALATAFFILGADGARAYCERRPEISAVLLPGGEEAQPVLLNLAPASWER